MKILEKFLTRDMSLIAMECWYEGRADYFKRFFDIPFPDSAFIFRNGAFEFYTDIKEFEVDLPKKLAKWLKNNKGKLLLAHRQVVDALDSFNKIKVTKKTSAEELLEYVDKIRKLFIHGFPGLLIMHHFPRFQNNFIQKKIILFDKQLIKKIIKWREAEGNVFFNKAVNIVYFLLKKIAKRKGWNASLLKYVTYQELAQTVKKKKVLPLNTIKKREDSIFIYFKYKIIYKPKINKKLKKMGYQIKKEKISQGIKVIKGAIVNSGQIKGNVKIVFNKQQLNTVKKGDILVAPMTSPWYLPAIKKATAIITDEGGITCHAAIVSRELNIPCIVDTKISTRVLKDGDLIEVDANKGIVKILKKSK